MEQADTARSAGGILAVGPGGMQPSSAAARLASMVDGHGKTVTQMLSAEGEYAKGIYAKLAFNQGFESFVREESPEGFDEIALANGFINHGNYLAYGFAATALHGLGIPFCFPALHGKTRRGALVFDVADLIKDSWVLPMAFEMAKKQSGEQDFRNSLIEEAYQQDILEFLMNVLKEICAKASCGSE